MTLPFKILKIFLFCWCSFLNHSPPMVLPATGLSRDIFCSPPVSLTTAVAWLFLAGQCTCTLLLLLALGPFCLCFCWLLLRLAVATAYCSSYSPHLLLNTAPAHGCSCCLLLLLTAEAAYCWSFSLLLLLRSFSLCCCSAMLALCLAPAPPRVVWTWPCKVNWFLKKSI